ncbi:MAG: hypothetical protein A2Z12_05020 [Actinobacteria bacterium RBG_16_68_21]|nr:MAG: hypothetical protein A2Z12_05020 [Actinobacteria bacterium RBG_16_68_21]
MLTRPSSDDLRIIGQFTGRIFLAFAGVSVLPLVAAIGVGEWAPGGSFLLMLGVFAILGAALTRLPTSRPLDIRHGVVVVALGWLLVPAVAAIPLALSGHFSDFIDVYFDAVSGLTTTGLSVLQDLDHLALSLNLWRHLLQFLGGLGIVVVAVWLSVGGAGLALSRSEGREDKILPSISSTSRFIWRVSLVHMAVGVAVLFGVSFVFLGFTSGRSLFHALMIFFAAFSTGGFSVQSTSLGYYHSPILEAAAGGIMLAGTMSFQLHFALWRRRFREAVRNLETRSFLTTFVTLLVVTMVGLATLGTYHGILGHARQGLFQFLSAHTTTGFSTVPSSELAGWTGLAFAGMVTAMALGGMAASTAGGVKALRVGLTAKVLKNESKRVMMPPGSVIPIGYFQDGHRRMTVEVAHAAMFITLLYLGLYLVGTGVGIAYGYSLQDALFESVSAGGTVGLSVGITDPSMPVVLQIVYMCEMWLGRLEFLAFFALIGTLWSAVRGR